MLDSLVWDGITRSASLSDEALRIRNELADRARRYEWAGVFALLTECSGIPEMVNVTRPDGRSWFAPLHQAAHGGAPVEVVEQFIESGAWRLLRTAAGELPVDIARRRGHRHLLAVLEPRPVALIDAAELAAIQRNFHAVIRGRAAKLVDPFHVRLPELEVLTDSEPLAGWFAVPGMVGGFAYALKSEGSRWRLISESWSRVVGGSGQRHEVSANGVRLVAEGFV